MSLLRSLQNLIGMGLISHLALAPRVLAVA
uniref:Uncharacterized protein n=1 Tax=Anguilla anguilla TaxID=7936 RepID=A0A0E9U233_ANGAN